MNFVTDKTINVHHVYHTRTTVWHRMLEMFNIYSSL